MSTLDLLFLLMYFLWFSLRNMSDFRSALVIRESIHGETDIRLIDSSSREALSTHMTALRFESVKLDGVLISHPGRD